MGFSNGLVDNTLAVVLAGGNGTRLDPLTRQICKPALPFGGAFRSIDFTLSNCVNSGVRTVGVATQYKPAALLAHLTDRWKAGAGGVVTTWHADERAPSAGYRGTADAVYRNLERIDEANPRLVLILAGDHVYKMDYRPMLEEHRARGADVTVGCVDVAVEDARHFGVLTLRDDGRIEQFVEKPQSTAALSGAARGAVSASMGIYVFNADFLRRVLTLDAFTPGSRHDFGADIFPKLIRNTRAFGHVFRGTPGTNAPYWRDIGTLRAYWQAHMDLLGPTPLLALDDPCWPVGPMPGAPRKISSAATMVHGGEVEDSLVGVGCVAGHVRRSVLFDDVEVGRDAIAVDCVALPGARIGAGCRLRGVIVDAGCRVPDGAVLERSTPAADPLVASAHHARAGTAPFARTG